MDETDETITLSSSSKAALTSPTVTITDDDATPSGVTLTLSSTSIAEGAGATTVTVTGTVGGTTTYGTKQTLSISVDGSGTAEAVDFAAVSDFDLEIAAEGTKGTATFTLTPTDDKVDEVNETVTVSSSNSIASNKPTITLTDNDAAPSGVTLSLSSTSVAENAGATTITVTGTVGGTTTYGAKQTLSISVDGSGTAEAVDFAAVSDFNLEIAAEGTKGTATFTLTPTDDKVDEVNETVTVSSSNSIASNKPTITITDNDAAPTGVTLSLSTTSIAENAGATTITVTGTVGGTTTYGAKQTLSISVDGSGTAEAVDFAAVSDFNLEIAAEGTKGTATFTLTPTDDTVDEVNETVTVSSSNSIASNKPTITITDNDAAPTGVTLTVSPTAVDEGAGATTVTVTGTVGGTTTYGAKQTLPIQVKGSGNANAVDFAAVSDFNLEIAAEGTSGTATFTLTPTDDQAAEADETVTVSSTSSVVSNAPTIRITDNDGGSAGTLALTADISTLSEGAGATTVTVTAATRDNSNVASAQTVTITATGSGTASAVDFAAVTPFTITVANGTSSGTGTFTLTPTDDKVDESTETITIGSSSVLVTQSTTITLTDDDATPTSVTLSLNTTSVSEGSGATTITLTGTVGGSTTFGTAQALPISVKGSGTATAVDFAAVSDFDLPLAAEASSGTATFTLTPTDDVVDEVNETITLSTTSSLVTGSLTITLTDNDATPSGVSLALNATSVAEGAGATTITLTGTVSGSTTYAAAQTLPISVTGSGTASAVDFASIADFDLAIAAEGTSGSATFTLTPTDDAVDEVNETITVRSSNSIASNAPTLTLTDNDATPSGVTLALNTTSIAENAGATTVTLTGTVGGTTTYAAAQTLPMSVKGSGVATAVDFASIADFDLPIAAESASGTATFTVTPVDDQADEVNETVTVSTTSSLVTGSLTITLTDDDATPAGIALTLSADTVDEGDGTTTITLTGAVAGTTTYAAAQTLPIRVSGSGVASAVDFAEVADFNLEIAAEGSSGNTTFDLTPEDDETPEVDETVTVSSTSSRVTTAPTVVITDNDGGSTFDLTLSTDVTELSEDAGATTVTVTAGTISGDALSSAASVPISITGSGVESAVDYSAASELTLTIASGASSGTATFTITPTDDAVDEANETITLVSTGTLASQAATITITDNDDTPTGVTLSISPDVVSEGDGETTITLEGVVTGGTTYGAEQRLPISVVPPQDDNAVDFAVVADFDLVVAAADDSARVTFVLIPEDDEEDEVDAEITLTSASSLVTNAPVLLLVDDDEIGLVLSLSHTEVSEGVNATTVTVTATTSDDSELPANESVPITVTGSGSGTAVDFTAVPAFTIAIAQGSSAGSGTFDLRPVNDIVDEADESITISSTHALVTQSVVLTLTDDDAPPTGIALTVDPDTVGEGDGATTITVTSTVTGGTTYSGTQTLPFTVTGSGLSDVVDFAAVAPFETVIDAEGVTATATFTLTPEDDQEEEGDEKVIVRTTNPNATNAPVVTIRDNDRQDIVLSVSPATIAEDAGATTVSVTATVARGTFADAQTVDVTVQESGTDAAVDFTAVQGFSITIDAHATTGSGAFTITPTDDTVDELDERVAVLSSHPNAYDSAFVALVDNDATPLGITLAASPSTAYEDDGPTQIAVTASVSGETQYADSQWVLVSVEGSGIESAVDFDAVPDFTVILPSEAGEGLHYFVLNPVDDLEGESGQTITISSSHPLVLNTAEVLLIDDDGGMTGTDDETPGELQIPTSYPNPTASEVTFVVEVPEYTAGISLRLYNVLGQQVAIPFAGALQAGKHAVRYDTSMLPAGVYMYVVASDVARHSGRFIVAR